jgi:hypothetical protein
VREASKVPEDRGLVPIDKWNALRLLSVHYARTGTISGLRLRALLLDLRGLSNRHQRRLAEAVEENQEEQTGRANQKSSLN